MSSNQQVLAALGGPASGQQAYTTAGTYSWVCPDGVTSVSVVCVGAAGTYNRAANGGGLAYKNNIAVTPGQSYSVVISSTTPPAPNASYFSSIGLVSARSGWAMEAGTAGLMAGDAFFDGGWGHVYTDSGGGGAAGYSGVGGSGARPGSIPATAGSGGGGGGGAVGGGGGGVGLLGYGSSGAAGVAINSGGGGGSGGSSGGYLQGGVYGGGCGHVAEVGGANGGGAVRIIWPGNLRQFPSTRTADE